MIDRIDAKILQELSRDSQQSIDRIAERVGLSATPVRRRIKRLENRALSYATASTSIWRNAGLGS